MNRRGAVLIVVAGLAAIIASLTFAFLLRMRDDAEETTLVLREAQARLMLAAGCDYVQEASRLGYDTWGRATRPGSVPADAHEEAYGWIDVRDGSVGPNTRAWRGDGGADDVVPLYDARAREPDGEGGTRPVWPAIGGVARCPMQALVRPPYAVRPVVTPNAISMDPADPTFGLPLLRHPDPVRAQPDASPASYAAYVAGDRRVRTGTADRAWFRVYRDGPSTFVVTCGAGGSRGFRTWDEIRAAGEAATFANDPALWRAIAEEETRLWFRIEWSAAVMALDFQHYFTELNGDCESYLTYPMNASQHLNRPSWVEVFPSSQSNARNPVGTIRWIQRLLREPSRW